MQTAVTQSDPATLIESTVFELLTAGAEFWARVDLTMPQLKVLLLLGRHGSTPVSWLAARMKVSPPNITGILDRLEQRRWVARTSNPQDRRVVRILLTAEGTQLLHDLAGAGMGSMRDSLRSLEGGTVDSLSRGLSAFLETIQHADGAAGEYHLADQRPRGLAS